MTGIWRQGIFLEHLPGCHIRNLHIRVALHVTSPCCASKLCEQSALLRMRHRYTTMRLASLLRLGLWDCGGQQGHLGSYPVLCLQVAVDAICEKQLYLEAPSEVARVDTCSAASEVRDLEGSLLGVARGPCCELQLGRICS